MALRLEHGLILEEFWRPHDSIVGQVSFLEFPMWRVVGAVPDEDLDSMTEDSRPIHQTRLTYGTAPGQLVSNVDARPTAIVWKHGKPGASNSYSSPLRCRT